MRSLLFFTELALLLPIAFVRPFVGVLIFCFISFSNLHRLSWGFAGAIPWAYIAFLATMVGCVVAREPKRLVVNPTMILMGAFIVCITITSVVALAPPSLVWAKWEQVAKVFLFLLVTAALVNERYRIHAMIWLMVISLGYYGVKGGGFTLLTGGGGRVLGPPSSMVADNNHLAAALLVAMPLMNYLRLQSVHRLVRIGLLAGMILTLFSVVGSYSRGALIGLGAVTIVLWLRTPNKIVTAGLFAVLVVTALSVMPQEWMDRMMTLREADQTLSGQSRLAMWQAAWNMAVARPLTGAGFMGPYTESVIAIYAPGTLPRAVHSIWFEVLGENGFPTFFVWLSMTVVAVLNTFRIIRDSRGIPELAWCYDLARMTQISIVAYLVAGTFLSLCYWDFYLTLLVIIAATRVIVVQAVRQRAEAVAPTTWRNRQIRAASTPAGSGGPPRRIRLPRWISWTNQRRQRHGQRGAAAARVDPIRAARGGTVRGGRGTGGGRAECAGAAVAAACGRRSGDGRAWIVSGSSSAASGSPGWCCGQCAISRSRQNGSGRSMRDGCVRGRPRRRSTRRLRRREADGRRKNLLLRGRVRRRRPGADAPDPVMLRLLTFTTLYPNETAPNHGVFVENRLRKLVATGAVESTVLAPVPFFPSSNARFGHWGRQALVPRREQRHRLTVHHPRYPVIPRAGMSVAPWLLFAASLRAARKLIAEGATFDAIDAHYFYPDGVAAVWLGRSLGLPVVVTARGSDVTQLPHFRVPRMLLQRAVRQADAMIAVSAALKTGLVSLGAAPGKVEVLRNGVDAEAFRPADRAAARAALGLRGPTLLSVGHLIERKGHHRTIEALRLLPEYELLVAGEGPEREALEALAQAFGVADRVRLLGALPHAELPGLYSAADMLVLASSREGWANVLLEAMACGTPVVASPIPGNPEVVQEPAAGLVAPANTPEGIAAAVRALAAKPPDRGATRAYAERFSWDATTDGQLRVFRRVLAARAAAETNIGPARAATPAPVLAAADAEPRA